MTTERPTKAAMADLQRRLDQVLAGELVDEPPAACGAIEAFLEAERAAAEEAARARSNTRNYGADMFSSRETIGGPATTDTAIGRILLHLAGRYGVPLAATVAPASVDLPHLGDRIAMALASLEQIRRELHG